MNIRLFVLCLLLTEIPIDIFAQKISDFHSVQPGPQKQQLVLPSTHTFQRIIRSEDPLSLGGQLGYNLDFTGYVPIAGSSTNGYLSISSETSSAECAVLSVSLQPTSKTWVINNSGKVNFPFSEIGNVATFCSGTVTPDGTVMVCEENTATGDANGDGYQDFGWVIEIDPATRKVINQDAATGADKLWAMGRQMHENVAIKEDESVIYLGADANPTGYLYKFIPGTAGKYSSGSLFVLQTDALLGTGVWRQIPNNTKAERNNTVSLSTSAGAYNFNGIEDVEIGPDNKIYFTSKGRGVIYRFRDLGNSVDQLEVFVSSTNYDVDGNGPYQPEPWGIGNDNLAFDGDGNLWVLQDGSRSHVWVVSPTHSSAAPAIRLFATTPYGSEPTGLTFTPDYKFMFLSFQHPSGSNTLAQTDASDQSVVFNMHTTVVIARKEFLGAAALPLQFTDFTCTERNNEVNIRWTVDHVSNHSFFEVQRSTDGVTFEKIFTNNDDLNNGGRFSFDFTDKQLPAASVIYYRIRQCDKDGKCSFSITQPVKVSTHASRLLTNPVSDVLRLSYFSTVSGSLDVKVIDQKGAVVQRATVAVITGLNTITLNAGGLPSGNYVLVAGESLKLPFAKIK